MYLEKLVVQGFKSFANKNELIFPGGLKEGKHGLTAVVGPNGSGKSNVADAIRWALGEQSMKTLRGKKSEDVIFSGSDKRGQLGMAEVSLYLNNEDGKSPLEYSQIVLTRRLYRDGNSEYLLNGSRVRLLDVQMMLARANFGQKTYSVIGQGMVEGFLNTSLAERKEFFDEATGVRQYQIKREEALNKLKSSIENLAQSQMLVAEIEPRLRTLAKQMSRLEKKGTILEELDQLQLAYYAHQWQDLQRRLSAVRAAMTGNEQTLADRQLEVQSLEQELSAMASEQSVSEEFDRWQQQLSASRAELAEIERRELNLSAWLKLAETTVASGGPELEQQRQQLQSELGLAKADLEVVRQQEDRRPRIAELGNEINVLERKRAEVLREVNRLDAWIEMKLESLGKFDLSFLTNRHNELATRQQELAAEAAALEHELKVEEQQLQNWRQRQAALSEEIKAVNEEWRRVSAGSANESSKQVNARLERSLVKLEQAELAEDLSAIRAALAEIRAELKEAMSFATGQAIQAELERLSQRLAELTEEREKINASIHQGSVQLATGKEKLRLSKHQAETVAREQADNAKKLEKAEEKFDADAARGQRQAVNAEQEQLAERLKTLTAELAELKLADDKKRLAWNTARDRHDSLERQIVSIQARIQEAKLASARHEAKKEELERLLVSTGLSEFNNATVEQALASLRQQRQQLDQSAAEAKAKLDEFNAAQEAKRRQLVTCQQALQAAQSQVNQLAARLNDDKLQAVRHETRLEDLEMEIKENYDHLERIQAYQVGDDFDAAEAAGKIKYLRRQLELIGSIDEDAEKEYVETKERFEFLSAQVNDLTETIGSLEEVIGELDTTIRERFDKEFDTIAAKFEEYFKILFNGGNAKIVKVLSSELDEEDKAPAEEPGITAAADSPIQATLKKLKTLSRINATGLAGIEIMATPPGKKIKSIAMLSGGERALTAIALICAIISANPSPFVVLDEVDAALDEANSERLARILEDLSEKTQFIVITHNRAPMRKAAILYGVTMQEDGVSKLLSVKLEDVKLEGR